MVDSCSHMTDVGTQLKDMTSDSPSTANDYQEHSRSPSQQDTTLTSDPLPSTRPHRPSSSSWLSLALLHLPESRVQAQPQPALLLNSTPGIFKGMRLIYRLYCFITHSMNICFAKLNNVFQPSPITHDFRANKDVAYRHYLYTTTGHNCFPWVCSIVSV